MKRSAIIALLLALLLCAAACAETAEPDLERFEADIAANTFDNTMTRHRNYLVDRNTYFEDEVIEKDIWITDADYTYGEWQTGYAAYNTADCFVYIDPKEGSDVMAVLYEDGEQYAKDLLYWQNYFTPGFGEDEALIETQERDGLFIGTTITRDEEAVSAYMGSVEETTGGYAYKDGMGLKFIHTFDAENSDLLQVDVFAVEADGTEYLVQSDRLSFDVDFDFASCAMAAWFDADAGTRTVTVTFRSGSDDENTREYTLTCETGCMAKDRDGVLVNAFADPECTQPMPYGEGLTDIHAYTK